jgi:hypothetical protein
LSRPALPVTRTGRSFDREIPRPRSQTTCRHQQLNAPLTDASAVNATRWALYEALADTGLPVEASSKRPYQVPPRAARHSQNPRIRRRYVGKGGTLVGWQIPTLAIKATGRDSYSRTKLTAHGFPRGHRMRAKSIHGFKTGDSDMVRADKKARPYIGRVAVRASGSFDVPTGVVQGVNAQHCTILHRADRYKYRQQRAALPLPASAGSVRANFR